MPKRVEKRTIQSKPCATESKPSLGGTLSPVSHFFSSSANFAEEIRDVGDNVPPSDADERNQKRMADLKKVIIHTDGGSEGNPGPGGWAAVLQYGPRTKEISGGEPATTNNRMELQAAIAALSRLKEPCEIEFFTDSEYLREGITSWITGWKARGWLTMDKKPVKNDDLWRKLDELAARHQITWRWLKGHAGHPLNERCDQLVGTEIAKIRKQSTPAKLSALLAEFEQQRSPKKDQIQLFE